MGVDMWAAELLLRMKEQQAYQDVELCLALPFEGYNTDWDDWHRKRMDFICRYAEKVLVLGEMPSSESYKKRNYYMVEQAGHMIAVYDNAHNMRSGTQQTVNYAKKKGLQIIYIHPDTAQVTEEDPFGTDARWSTISIHHNQNGNRLSRWQDGSLAETDLQRRRK